MSQWTKNHKGYYTVDVDIPKVVENSPAVNLQWSPFFDYGDFAVPFSEFTFVYNYSNKDLEGDSLADTDTLGMSLHLEWDFLGETKDLNQAFGLYTSETTQSNNVMFSDLPTYDNCVIAVPDIDLVKGAVSAANICRFRFKFGYQVNSGKVWPVGTSVRLAIIPM